MNNRELPDLILKGVSDAGGGAYGVVKIEGMAKVHGDVSAVTFTADGHLRVNGGVTAERFELNGKMTAAGALRGGHLRFNGHTTVKGSVSGEHLSLNGLLSASGDCECELFEGEGGFEVGGLLSAGTLNVKLHGRGAAREIGVETIVVRQAGKSAWNKLWKWLFPKFSPELRADTIEGDNIDVEHTIADVIRGSRVSIGKGCVVGRVEYKGDLRAHPSAVIKERVKTDE
ncbi:hypothetical protein [Cohnella sp. GCM10027633]|uniref:hypothetical protein n=1 Tax=unclassified Cohnella TaxID=2636738 RepID=UPI00362A4868